MAWTLRDGLSAYVEVVKFDALQQYRSDVLSWAVLAPHQKKPGKPPSLPSILQ